MPTCDHSLAGCSSSAPSRTTPSVVSPSALNDARTPCWNGDSYRTVRLPAGCSVARQQSCTSLQQPTSSAHRKGPFSGAFCVLVDGVCVFVLRFLLLLHPDWLPPCGCFQVLLLAAFFGDGSCATQIPTARLTQRPLRTIFYG
uniref:(northern house mosquito) hypothetical protein n=1 Tax=Culex pipiens TaxID=7175 RepID=A0A8D8GP39_CULPI